MRNSAENIGVIILAAGASKRLGRAKQTLRFQDETLLKRAAKTALASACRPVIVVLGADAEKLKPEIEEFETEIAENPDWENGMGSSIRAGLKKLLEIQPDVSGAVLMVCDQPFVSAEIIDELTEVSRATNAPIVACAYGETIGVPALFSRNLFPELMTLEPNGGAKKLIYKYKENIVAIPFEAGAIDVDTEQDYLNLVKLMKNGKRKTENA